MVNEWRCHNFNACVRTEAVRWLVSGLISLTGAGSLREENTGLADKAV